MAASEFDKKVGIAVKALREEGNIPRQEFAKRVGVNVDQLDGYLKGHAPFPLAVLMSCAVELQTGLDDIFIRAGVMEARTPEVEAAIQADPALRPKWKDALRGAYRAALAAPDAIER